MPHKNTRKLIRIGNTSLAVILPKPWLKYYNLGFGDRVEVISNGTIVIRKEIGENNFERSK